MLVPGHRVGGTLGSDSHPDRPLCANHMPRVPPTQGTRWEPPPAGSWGPTALSPAALALCWEPPDQTLPVQGVSSSGSPAPRPAESCLQRLWVRQEPAARRDVKFRTPEPRTLITSGSQDEGGSNCQDCSLVHLKPGRMKDGSMLSRKTQGPPGKQTWTWWLQPQTWRSGREGLTVPCTRAALPRSLVPSSKGRTSRATFGGLTGLGLQATPLPGQRPRPAPLPVAAAARAAMASERRGA